MRQVIEAALAPFEDVQAARDPEALGQLKRGLTAPAFREKSPDA